MILDTKDKKEQYNTALLGPVSAKRFFNLALYAIDDEKLASQAAVKAVSDTYKRFPDETDQRAFERQCLCPLYRYGKKAVRECGINSGAASRYADFTDGCQLLRRSEADRLADLLSGLSFEERFILLLFCWFRCTLHEIARATRLPVFIVKRRLSAAVDKVEQRAG